MKTGIRIRIYPGEGAYPESFAGEIINPTERQMRGNGHVSCLWDRAQVVRVEVDPVRALTPRTDAGEER